MNVQVNEPGAENINQGVVGEQTGVPGQSNASVPAGKKGREAEIIEMSDGRKIEFVGKQKLLKEALVRLPDGNLVPIDDAVDEHLRDGELAIRMDFRNGATRTYPLNTSLLHRFAAHGALQKYGDQLAGGVKKEDGSESLDLDDWAYETDALHDQLKAGEWAKTRVGGGGGISVFIQALVEYTGRTLEEVKVHIKDWTPAQRQQIRLDEEIKPIIERIEKEKAAKNAGNVDTGALKAGLKALAS